MRILISLDDESYQGVDIADPPATKASAGRANRKGQVVLYCADQEETAIAEVRPARGNVVSLAGSTSSGI